MMAYLKKRGIETLQVDCDIEYNSVQYINYYPDIDNLPSFVENTIEEIIESYADELYDLGPNSIYDETSDYFSVNIEIEPEKQTMTFVSASVKSYDIESDGRYYEIGEFNKDTPMYNRFIEIQKFLKEQNLDEIFVDYNGGGDSGYIEGQFRSGNNSGDLSVEIEEIAYELLEEFGGWEINEGSSGNIRMSNDEIEIEHEWNVEIDNDIDLNIEITSENIV
jgi:hypothetical protein